MIYDRQGIPMDISNNYDKEGRPKCFNCNKYRHMAKECQKKKEKDTRKCFKYKRVGHLAKDCKEKQQIGSIKEESDNENKEKDFGKDLKQAQYERFIYLTLKIDILFHIKGTILRKS